ncbi:hypothetical protein MUK42_04750 [Musa troglodytarum]|uniref:PMI1/PMIR1-2 C-terminal domain-containing protein n=1 Tax=Musa troglodytarum TaxID=320322 RepID=A0A9E7K2N9_9LILI|nr:hypothetical protein MUK42_04750 [Musa troglodytarum]
MNPSLFRDAKNNGNLIMQVSGLIVVPAEMGSASVGIEKLSGQASVLMPLEDISGKTMQRIAWDSATALDSCERFICVKESSDAILNSSPILIQASLDRKSLCPRGLGASQNVDGRREKSKGMTLASSSSGERSSEYVSLEDMTAMAMDNVEALSVEGLRIQTGMSDEEAPINIIPQSVAKISAREGNVANDSWSPGLVGTGITTSGH